MIQSEAFQKARKCVSYPAVVVLKPSQASKTKDTVNVPLMARSYEHTEPELSRDACLFHPHSQYLTAAYLQATSSTYETMKISIFALAALASSVSAELSLRASISSFLNSAETEAHDARIVVGGITGDALNEQDAALVTEEAKAAYNNVFGFDTAGQKFGDIKTRGFSKVPADACWWGDEKSHDAALVSAQVDVLSYREGFNGVSSFGDLHKKFEQDLCDRLRKSDVSKFSQAKDCSFSFVEHSGLTKNKGPVEASYTEQGENLDAQLMLVGLNGELSEKNVEFLNKVVVESHNKAFQTLGISIESFQTLAQVHTGKANQGWLDQCTFCCWVPDDDRYDCPTYLDEVTILPARIRGATVYDDNNDSNKNKNVNVQTKMSHADFENLVCLELRTSGNPVFEHVHDCNFHFIYNPVGKSGISGM
jgi:hypothetical protein